MAAMAGQAEPHSWVVRAMVMRDFTMEILVLRILSRSWRRGHVKYRIFTASLIVILVLKGHTQVVPVSRRWWPSLHASFGCRGGCSVTTRLVPLLSLFSLITDALALAGGGYD